jgi:hypothetical protein
MARTKIVPLGGTTLGKLSKIRHRGVQKLTRVVENSGKYLLDRQPRGK